MKRYIIPVIFLLLLAGCISIDQQATLTTKYKNASDSIEDLENNIQSSDSQEIYDEEKQMDILFHYKPGTKEVQKITVSKKSEPDIKHVINYYLQNSSILQAKVEVHHSSEEKINLSNHTFLIEKNKVKDCIYHNSIKLDPTDPQVAEEVEMLESDISYISQTYLEI